MPADLTSSGQDDLGREPSETDASDDLYVRRFQFGDRDALVELIGRHERAVRRLLLGLWADRYEIDDLCQDVFLRLIEHLPDLSPPKSLRPWLYRTAVNLVRDRVRRRRVRRWINVAGRGVGDYASRSSPAADATTEHQELVDRLHAEIHRLRPAWREVVVLRDLVSLSSQETAEVLSVSARVVNDRVYRARRELAARLSSS